MELEVGITERLTSGARFDSVMKRVFQDFHVKEIDRDNIVLSLDELITRTEVAGEVRENAAAVDAAYQSIGPDFSFTSEQTEALVSLITDDDLLVLRSFLQTLPDAATPYCVLPSDKLNEDKDNRKNFHAFVRQHFGSCLSTDTLEEGESRSIRVWISKFHQAEQARYKQAFHASGGNRNKKQRPARDNAGVSVGVMMRDPWPKERPDYLHFRMYKENRDTAEAIQSIARCLRLPPKSFSFCGTKDRRGITVQGVSVYRVSIESMRKAILHSSWDNAVRISNLEYKNFSLKIGGAGGNHFAIALRHIAPDTSDDSINDLYSQLQQNGFLNYYGLQRFGTRSVRTHHIGGLLFAQNWKGVVDALLSPAADERNATSEGIVADESADRSAWRTEYANNNIEAAHDMCPSYLYIEKSLLRALHLSGQSTNYLNAIQSLPTSTCHLYLHAVQSLVFNEALSERIKRHGLKVVVGDLVAAASSKRPREDDPELDTEEVDDGKVDDVKLIETEEEASQYSIYDVVLTLVGSTVKVSPNMTDFYSSIFTARFDCAMECLTGGALPSFIRLRGAYRKIVQKANNLEWEIFNDVCDKDVLIKSDLDRLNVSLEDPNAESADVKANADSGVQKDEKKYKAVVFECDLNSGVYLTMALREITQILDTCP